MKSAIKTVEQAFAYLNRPFYLPILTGIADKHQAALIALYQLFIITEALNKEANDGKEWEPTYDGDEWHYFPVFYRGADSGSGFSFGDAVDFRLYSTVGSRLEFISEEVCEYAAETFLDLYRDAFVILPQAKEA